MYPRLRVVDGAVHNEVTLGIVPPAPDPHPCFCAVQDRVVLDGVPLTDDHQSPRAVSDGVVVTGGIPRARAEVNAVVAAAEDCVVGDNAWVRFNSINNDPISIRHGSPYPFDLKRGELYIKRIYIHNPSTNDITMRVFVAA